MKNSNDAKKQKNRESKIQLYLSPALLLEVREVSKLTGFSVSKILGVAWRRSKAELIPELQRISGTDASTAGDQDEDQS
jgi:hypothetical protein